MPVIGPQISGDIGTLTGSGVALAVAWSARSGPVSASRSRSVTHSIASGPYRASAATRISQLAVAGSARARVVGTVNVARDHRGRADGGRRGGDSGHAGAQPPRVGGHRPGPVHRIVPPAHRGEVTTRQVLPGALLATGCWLGLQALGGVFVTQVLAGSSQTYGGFAAVVGLLSWLLIAVRADPDRCRAQRRAR